MSPTLRTAYEKRSLLGGTRWGRRSDVPLEIYYELDNLHKQVDGLSQGNTDGDSPLDSWAFGESQEYVAGPGHTVGTVGHSPGRGQQPRRG